MTTSDTPRWSLPSGILKGEVALVTGGGTGLGRAIAVEMARAGAKIVIASRNEGHRRQGVESVQAVGGEAVDVPLDLRDLDGIDKAFATAEEKLGSVTQLINNAAANFYSPAEAITPNGWNAVVDRVLTGTFFCTQAYARRRIAAGGGGAIVNMVASTGINGGPGVAHSAASKAGLISLTRTLAAEWAGDQIRVNAVAPGLIVHDDGDEAIRAGRIGWDEDASRKVPIGRTGRPEEIAWLVTYLCSPLAGFITGQTIAVDGGSALQQTVSPRNYVAPREQLADYARPK